ncbi:MAG: Transcriptional regulatory protein ZraR, partial [Planctomycetota bacterium]
LELAAEFTTAASFGWFVLADDDRVDPVCVVPPGSGLAAVVTGQAEREARAGRAVWLTKPDGTGVACIPITDRSRPVAMLAASAPRGLRETDFDLLLPLAGFAAAARAGREPAPATPSTTDPFEPGRQQARCGGPDEGTISLAPETVRAWQALEQAPAGILPGEGASLRIEEWERALAVEALRRSGGEVPAAAALLGISRATLYRRLESWGLTREQQPSAPG